MKSSIYLILGVVAMLLLTGCGGNKTTGGVVKESETPQGESPAVAPSESPPVEAPKQPVDKAKLSFEAAGLYGPKYCNYKIGALKELLSAKEKSADIWEKQNAESQSDQLEKELSALNAGIKELEAQISKLEKACEAGKLGDLCADSRKDIQDTISLINVELADDKDSFAIWEKKLADAQSGNDIMQIGIAKAKMEIRKTRIQNSESRLNAFNEMLTDLDKFC